MRVVGSDHRSFRLVLLVILGRDWDVLDDGDIEPTLALGVLMHLDLLQPRLWVIPLKVVELLGDCLKIDLPVLAGRDDVDVVFRSDWILIIEAVVLHLQLLEAAV